jgi:diacylglycerol kinase family enzyme
MRVTALYNPEAGAGRITRQRLTRLLERAGYRATYHSAKGRTWKKALENPGDLVVVAGGDGTTAKVAKRLAGRGVPLAILPGGTANNIARSLALDAPLEELVDRWSVAPATPVDLGLITGPWGEEMFFEAAGLGVFPRMLEIAAAYEKMSSVERARVEEPLHGIELMIELVRSTSARPWKVRVDDRDLSGDYVMLEAMNIRQIGGAIDLAPAAVATDGLLHVISVRESDREAFLRYLREIRGGAVPSTSVARPASRIEIECAETVAHIDDEPWPEGGQAPGDGRISIAIQPGAIEVLL